MFVNNQNLRYTIPAAGQNKRVSLAPSVDGLLFFFALVDSMVDLPRDIAEISF